jgi:UDP-3-O-[3-hydroxymyristoyl] glucosamine N-acyltransferase
VDITLAQLALHIGGTLQGGGADCPVTGVAGLDSVADGEVTFVLNARYLDAAEASPALALIAPPTITSSVKPVIHADDPRAAFARALGLFDWRRMPMAGVHPSAAIAQSAGIHARASIGAHVSVGEFSTIGDGAVIFPNVVIGDHVEIGAGCIVYPNAVIYARVTLGQRVIVHAGTILGSDGMGYQPTPEGWVKLPHLGTVVIEDDVEIGANVTVDRATTGETRIGAGTKIDNLVQIAHNVKIGKNCMILAQVGISGSCTIDDNVILGGQAGLRDHLKIGAGAIVIAQSGLSRDVKPGTIVQGTPAQPHDEELRTQAIYRRLPKIADQLKAMDARLKALEKGEG